MAASSCLLSRSLRTLHRSHWLRPELASRKFIPGDLGNRIQTRWFSDQSALAARYASSLSYSLRSLGRTRPASLGYLSPLMAAPSRSYHVVPEARGLSLGNMKPNLGSNKEKIRLGRGRSTRRGRKCGRGQKGLYGRGGSMRLGFEGGSTPLYLQVPKRSYPKDRRPLSPLSLFKLQHFIDQGRIDPNQPITIKSLWKSGILKRTPRFGVRLTGTGAEFLKAKVDIKVTKSDGKAADAILKRGGKLTLVYYNRLGLRAHLKPEKWTERGMPLPRFAQPVPILREYYHARNTLGEWIRPIQVPEDVIFLKPQFGKLSDNILYPSIREQAAER